MWDSAIFYAIAKCVIRKRITDWKTSRRTKAIGMLETVSLSIQKVRLFYNFISRVFPRWGPWCASESPGLCKCTSSGPIKMCGIRTLEAEHFNKPLICKRQTKGLEMDLGWWWGVEFFTESTTVTLRRKRLIQVPTNEKRWFISTSENPIRNKTH